MCKKIKRIWDTKSRIKTEDPGFFCIKRDKQETDQKKSRIFKKYTKCIKNENKTLYTNIVYKIDIKTTIVYNFD